jgi:hypothetical protein
MKEQFKKHNEQLFEYIGEIPSIYTDDSLFNIEGVDNVDNDILHLSIRESTLRISLIGHYVSKLFVGYDKKHKIVNENNIVSVSYPILNEYHTINVGKGPNGKYLIGLV